ncbi:MAG: hypothetical protein RL557_616 [archaeon]
MVSKIKSGQKEKESKKIKHKFLKQIGFVLLITSIATFIDFLVHSSSASFYVPFEYYQNKVIFATIWGMVILFVVRKMKNMHLKSFIFSLFIAAVLQVKYFFQGYDLFFVILFLFLHFLMFLVPSWIIFNKYKEYF